MSYVPQCNMQEGLEGNPIASTMKNVSRGLAVLTVPFTMSFPKVSLLLLVAWGSFALWACLHLFIENWCWRKELYCKWLSQWIDFMDL